MYPKNRRERFLIGKRKGEKRSARYWNGYTWFPEKDRDECIKRHEQLRRNTTKLCSCNMCGNPRRHFKERTMQEKKFLGLQLSWESATLAALRPTVRTRLAPFYLCAHSSAGQSNGFLNRRSQVRVLLGVPYLCTRSSDEQSRILLIFRSQV